MTRQPHAEHQAQSDPGDHQAVAPLELFFDLVFVFGLSQLSEHLLHHLTLRGFAETVVLLLTTFTVWFYVSWQATLTSVTRSSTRARMLLVMPLGLLMNVAIHNAFAEGGWSFAVPYLVAQLGCMLWIRQTSTDALFRGHYTRTLVWIAATVPLWLIGAASGAETRLWWWGTAAAIDLTGTLLAHPLLGQRFRSEHVGFDSEHIQERGRLLFIIALGETVLTTGTAMVEAPREMLTFVTGLLALGITVALWYMTFGRTDRLVAPHLENTSNPIAVSMLSSNFLPLLMLGLILLAVAGELVIAHPLGHGSFPLNLLLFGGPSVVIGTLLYYQRVMTGTSSRVRLLSCAALIVSGLITLSASPILSLLLATAVLAVFTVLDRKEEQATRPS